MNNLLQSRRFKANLKRWLLMYVGTILIFTAVITYSRYISTFCASGTAKVARFNVVITGQKVKDIYYPNDSINYNFLVIPTFDVKTLLALTIKPKEKYEIQNIRVNNDTIYSTSQEVQRTPCETNKDINICYKTGEYTINKENNIIISRKINAGDNDVIAFELDLKYQYDPNTYYTIELKAEDILSIDYSANQELN